MNAEDIAIRNVPPNFVRISREEGLAIVQCGGTVLGRWIDSYEDADFDLFWEFGPEVLGKGVLLEHPGAIKNNDPIAVFVEVE